MAKTKKPISQEEYTTNKVLTVFSVCLLGVLVLMILQRLLDYANTWRVGMIMQKCLLVLGAAGVIWGVVLFWREKTGKRAAARRILCSRNVLIASVILVIAMSVIGLYGSAPIKVLYVILPVLAVYYLIYHSYAPEFFVIAVNCGFALGLVWVVRQAQVSANYSHLAYIAAAVMAAVALIQVICVLALRGRKGRFRFNGREIDWKLSRNAYTMLVLTPVVMAAVVLAAALLPAAGLICMGVTAGYVFVTAVYYTVKLM